MHIHTHTTQNNNKNTTRRKNYYIRRPSRDIYKKRDGALEKPCTPNHVFLHDGGIENFKSALSLFWIKLRDGIQQKEKKPRLLGYNITYKNSCCMNLKGKWLRILKYEFTRTG